MREPVMGPAMGSVMRPVMGPVVETGNELYSDELRKALSRVPERSRIMVVGQPDTGKSTLIASLARYFHRLSREVAVVDSDVGQADVGPPGFVSYGNLEVQAASLSAVVRKGSYLVGSTSPYGRQLPVVTGTEACVRYAEKEEAGVVLVDTSGLVSPRVGVQLKCAKACAVQPHLIIAIDSPGTGPLLHSLGMLGFTVVSLTPAPDVQTKTTERRRENRARGWTRYLESALAVPLDLDVVKVYPWWGETRYVNTGEMSAGTVVGVPDPLRPGLQIPAVWIVSESGPVVLGALPMGYEPGSIWAASYKLRLDGKQVISA